jgi:Na+-driven multidrug efflux pump
MRNIKRWVVHALFVLLLIFASGPVFSIFTTDEKVIELAPVFVSAILWSFPAMCLMKGTGALIQGVGNAALSLVFGILDGVVFRIGFSYLFGIIM